MAKLYSWYFATIIIKPQVYVKLYVKTAVALSLGKMEKKVATFWRHDLWEQIEHMAYDY